MNLGLLMGLSAPSMPATSPAVNSNSVGSGGFGSVFQSMMSAPSMETAGQPLGAGGKLAQLITDMVNAETIEELDALVNQLKQSDVQPAVINHFLNELGYRPSKAIEAVIHEELGVESTNKLAAISTEEQMASVLPREGEQSKSELPLKGQTELAAIITPQNHIELLVAQLTSRLQQAVKGEQPSSIEELVSSIEELVSSKLLVQEVVTPEKVVDGEEVNVIPSHVPLALQDLLVGEKTKTPNLTTSPVVEDRTKESWPSISPVLGELIGDEKTKAPQLPTSGIPQEVVVGEEAKVSPTIQGEGATDPVIPKEQANVSKPANSHVDVVSEKATDRLELVDVPNLKKLPSLKQMSSLISENPVKLVETIIGVLETVGVPKEKLEQIRATGDVWLVLDVLQKLPPEEIQQVVQKLPEKVVAEMTALFKTIELATPKMDLYASQVELVKTIQPLVAQFAPKQEEKLVEPEAKKTVQFPTAVHQRIIFSAEQSATDAKQQEPQTKSGETQSTQPVTTQSETTRPVFQMPQTEKAPESRSEALMKEFQAILNRANFGQTNGMNRLSIKLYPENLGQVRIELLEVNGVMTARILATSAMAREMLDSKMHQLRHAFSQQNLQVDRIELTQALQDPSKNDREQAFNKQNGQHKEKTSDEKQQQDEHETTFEEFMIELEV